MQTCKICNNSQGNTLHVAREMMFGLRNRFEYLECGACGCLQITDVPADLARYYPADYWQFEEKRADFAAQNSISAWVRHQRARYWLLPGFNPLGRLLAARRPQPRYFGWLRRAGVDFDSPILDVGCGIGDRLLELRKDGFRNLTGIDPYIDSDIRYDNGVNVYKMSLTDMTGEFDFIMLNHSFEHMPDPEPALIRINRLLGKGRIALIRIPVASSYAWRKYRANWAQLDAPRHLFLHTVDSMKRLSERANFLIKDVIYDSDIFQCWGSEQYARDIAMYEPGSYEIDPVTSIFSFDEIQRFRKLVRELNRTGQGDQACFYLYKP